MVCLAIYIRSLKVLWLRCESSSKVCVLPTRPMYQVVKQLCGHQCLRKLSMWSWNLVPLQEVWSHEGVNLCGLGCILWIVYYSTYSFVSYDVHLHTKLTPVLQQRYMLEMLSRPYPRRQVLVTADPKLAESEAERRPTLRGTPWKGYTGYAWYAKMRQIHRNSFHDSPGTFPSQVLKYRRHLLHVETAFCWVLLLRQAKMFCLVRGPEWLDQVGLGLGEMQSGRGDYQC